MSDRSVLRQLAELPRLPMSELKAKWQELIGPNPPQYNREVLVSRLAHRLQELAYRGLSRSCREQMERLLQEAGYDEIGRKPTRPARGRTRDAMVAGTKLIREWGGERHEVTAVPGGFEYRGRGYRSLTAVAQVISGSHWSGPAFFGLRRQGRRGGDA